MFGIKFYTIIASALGISQIITSTWLCGKITDNHSNAKSVSLYQIYTIIIYLFYVFYVFCI